MLSSAWPQQLRFEHLRSGASITWAANGQGPALVRAAHWMNHVEHDLTSPIWRPCLERLGREKTLIRYDERGCGLSGPDDTPLGLKAALEELEVVVEAAGLKQVALLGMSGAVAPVVAFAARHPERVTQLVLLGGYTHGLLHRQPTLTQLALHEARVKLVELGWGLRDSPVQQFFTAQMIPDATPEQIPALNEQQRLSCDGARAAAILRARLAMDVRDDLPRLRCPTLVQHCQGDGMVPVELGRELAAAIAGARFETLASRNHIPLAGEPAFERFCQALRAFIQPGLGAEAAIGFTPSERLLLALVAQGATTFKLALTWGWPTKRCATHCPSSTRRSGSRGGRRRWHGRVTSVSAESGRLSPCVAAANPVSGQASRGSFGLWRAQWRLVHRP